MAAKSWKKTGKEKFFTDFFSHFSIFFYVKKKILRSSSSLFSVQNHFVYIDTQKKSAEISRFSKISHFSTRILNLSRKNFIKILFFFHKECVNPLGNKLGEKKFPVKSPKLSQKRWCWTKIFSKFTKRDSKFFYAFFVKKWTLCIL